MRKWVLYSLVFNDTRKFKEIKATVKTTDLSRYLEFAPGVSPRMSERLSVTWGKAVVPEYSSLRSWGLTAVHCHCDRERTCV